MLDRGPESISNFLIDHQNHPLTVEESVRALELMEMQRHAQLMYTSCGWFFDDISGIETVQIIAYAARVLQLAHVLFGAEAAALEPAFLDRLSRARSNVASAGDGAQIYRDKIGKLQLGLEQVVAHYAISSIFSSFSEETELFCYNVRRISYETFSSGRGRLAIGRVHIASAITGLQSNYSFAVLHFGDQNITAAVKAHDAAEAEAFEISSSRPPEQVLRADFPKVIRLLDSYFGHVDYSLTSLFTDEQRRIVQIILNSTLWDIEKSMTTIYEEHASLLALSIASWPAQASGAHPGRRHSPSMPVLRRALEADPIDEPSLRSYLALAKADQVTLETVTLSYIADQRMKRAMIELLMSSGSLEMLDRALTLARIFTELPFDLNLWQAQNVWYEILRTSSYALTSLTAEDRPLWDKAFKELALCLSIDPEAITVQDLAAVTTGD